MFCPNCKYEYLPETIMCPDCDEPLVTKEELDAMPDENEKLDASPLLEELQSLKDVDTEIDWVHIARINSKQMADMILQVLHAKGIASVIHSETGYFGMTGQIGMSSYQPIGGGYSLFVDKNCLEDVDNEASILMGDEWEKCKLVNIN